MLKARLDKTGLRVLCGVKDCGYELAWVLERGVYAEGRWQRGLWFGPGWAPRADGVWSLTPRAMRRRRRGQAPAHRRADAGGKIVGMIPVNLPIEAVCPDCDFRQQLAPDILGVHPLPFAGLWSPCMKPGCPELVHSYGFCPAHGGPQTPPSRGFWGRPPVGYAHALELPEDLERWRITHNP